MASENIEGLDQRQSSMCGDYPIDSVLIRTETRTVYEVLRRINKNSFVMNPDFQRDFIWDNSKQSKLIESVMMRIPLPAFYLAEDKVGRMIVVDGLQRLSTFKRFIENDLRLRLPDSPHYDKRRFNDLEPKLQNRIEDCNLILYIIDNKVPERARLDIFERVNSGVPLTRQQMRNSLYTGEATRFLRTEANSQVFLEATGRSLRKDTMRDREFVNRFCAFELLGVTDYRDMDEHLSEVLTTMNSMNTSELKDLSAKFRRGLRNSYSLFGRHSFRRHEPGQRQRFPINASLWDVMSTGLVRLQESTTSQYSEEIRDQFYRLMDDESFVRSITYSPNSSKNVRARFASFDNAFGEFFEC